MHSYEIEIKSLLGSSENADVLRAKLFTIDPNAKLIKQNKQLNHYFTGGDCTNLYTHIGPLFKGAEHEKLKKIVEEGKNFSVRTRESNGTVLLVVKASIDDTTSSNGISRIEFEERVPLTLPELDAFLEKAGFTYQAKWSREREEYTCNGTTICLDKNAGYGYVAEFERVVNDASKAEEVKETLRALMEELGAEELPQDRLERMFAHYNLHWPEYYGTNKIFVVE